jgi:hypothetical protein
LGRGSCAARSKPGSRSIAELRRISCSASRSLIPQQHDDQASVYRESFEKNGYGFHHWGIASDRYDHDLASYLDRGFELVFTDETPAATRVAYFAKRGWPGFIELIEINSASELRYSQMYAEALLWDGKDAVRKV